MSFQSVCLSPSLPLCVCVGLFKLQVEEKPFKEQNRTFRFIQLKDLGVTSWKTRFRYSNYDTGDFVSPSLGNASLCQFYFLIVASFIEAGESCRVTSYRTHPINGRRAATFQEWWRVPSLSLNQFRMVLPANNAKLDKRGLHFSHSKKLEVDAAPESVNSGGQSCQGTWEASPCSLDFLLIVSGG